MSAADRPAATKNDEIVMVTTNLENSLQGLGIGSRSRRLAIDLFDFDLPQGRQRARQQVVERGYIFGQTWVVCVHVDLEDVAMAL